MFYVHKVGNWIKELDTFFSHKMSMILYYLALISSFILIFLIFYVSKGLNHMYSADTLEIPLGIRKTFKSLCIWEGLLGRLLQYYVL